MQYSAFELAKHHTSYNGEMLKLAHVSELIVVYYVILFR